MVGGRKRVKNDVPIVGVYGVNHEGSGDMYDKGGNMLHTIRQIVDNDAKWRRILRGLGSTFWHQTVTGKQVENYMSRRSGIDLGRVFDQYLRTTKIPALEYRVAGTTLSYRWSNVVPGFDMPVKVTLSPYLFTFIRPTEAWKATRLHLSRPDQFQIDENFYIVAKDLAKPSADSATVRKAP
jgi:Aminopeptidase N